MKQNDPRHVAAIAYSTLIREHDGIVTYEDAHEYAKLVCEQSDSMLTWLVTPAGWVVFYYLN